MVWCAVSVEAKFVVYVAGNCCTSVLHLSSDYLSDNLLIVFEGFIIEIESFPRP